MERPKCIKDRCLSPVACTGFGYCRELNFYPEFEWAMWWKGESDEPLLTMERK